MTKGFKNVAVPIEIYELIRAAAYRQHISMAQIMRDMAGGLTQQRNRRRS